MTKPVSPRHILVSRTDKIGDLLLSLPVFQSLKEAFPQTRLTALVSSYAKEIVQGHPAIDGVEVVEKEESPFRLASRFKKMNVDILIALYPRVSIVSAAWLAGVPERIGTAYRWYSFLLTEKIKVHRSIADRHEVEYNLDLIKPLGVTSFARKIQLPLTAGDRDFAKDLLKEKGIPFDGHYVAVHPGHRGSALNWKPKRYAEIIGKLIQKGQRVVLTAGAEETELVSLVSTFLSAQGAKQKPVLLIGECTLKQLAAVYERADCFLSGSTGTMHLAAAMGTPTVSLFCPIPETTPVRWGPWGNESTVLTPKNTECADCRTGHCQKHDPMDDISVDEVYRAMEKYFQKKRK
jgi:ADP-heptose:LPS heptosyltransferase